MGMRKKSQYIRHNAYSENDDDLDKIRPQCHNSSVELRVYRYLGTFSGSVQFVVTADDTQQGFNPVPINAVAHVHCNVTTEAPRFASHQLTLPMHHCLPSDTHPFAKLSVEGGEPPIVYSMTYRNPRVHQFRLNATSGELFLVHLINPYRYSIDPNARFTATAVDGVGRVAKAEVRVAETCDEDPPVHFTKPYYEFVFSNCSSNAEDEAVGRVEAAGNSSYQYVFRQSDNPCKMIEVKPHSGTVTFGPALCRREPDRCCKRGQVYSGAVAVLDTRTGRPASKTARLQVTNACSYPEE